METNLCIRRSSYGWEIGSRGPWADVEEAMGISEQLIAIILGLAEPLNW